MKIAVCEDEEAHLEKFSSMLSSWSSQRGVDVDCSNFKTAEALLMLWGDVIFDVLILDIEMGKMTGMELAKTIRRMDEDVTIIFVTSHTSYSLEGYEVNPLHFLTKPLDENKFYTVLDKALAIYNLKNEGQLIVNTADGAKRLVSDRILYISMYSHDANICTVSDSFSIRATARELMEDLPSHFLSCHRSYIVNMMKVDCVFSDYLVLLNKTEIPISRGHSKEVRDYFMRLRTE